MSAFDGVFPEGAVIIAEEEREDAYDGSGCAIARLPDGSYVTAEYAHCSCDGPEETMTVNAIEPTIELAMRHIGVYDKDRLQAKLDALGKS